MTIEQADTVIQLLQALKSMGTLVLVMLGLLFGTMLAK